MQPRYMVHRHVIETLVRDCPSRGCSEYRPEVMWREFHALPTIRRGYVDYQAAVRVVKGHWCCKLTGDCSRPNRWMLHRLRYTKVPLHG